MPAEHQLHNVTTYVSAADLERVASVYRDALGMPLIFAEQGHISCFAACGEEVALCVHEEERDHPAGSVEIYFWAEPQVQVSPSVQLRLHRRVET